MSEHYHEEEDPSGIELIEEYCTQGWADKYGRNV